MATPGAVAAASMAKIRAAVAQYGELVVVARLARAGVFGGRAEAGGRALLQ